MNRRSITLGAAGAAAALMILGHPGVASAAEKPVTDQPGRQRVDTAIRHAIAGKATTADLAVIKNDPVLARTVPVRVKVGKPVYGKAAPPAGKSAQGARTSAKAGADAAASADQLCRSVDYPLTLTSYLGSTIYTWHHAFSWCTANTVPGAEATRVVSAAPYNRSDYFTDKSSVAYPQGLLTDAVFAPAGGPIGLNTTGAGSPYYSHMARSVNLCFAQYSCYASNLPQSKLTIGRDNVAVALASPL
ncbi:hypothetical protein [Streptomyces sp. NPDC047108]|uniref:hypothetical protein n=1 Tax=Streptomyces sp. NPDC047108 TaxID=3155025 RepID=UPI00340F7312